MFGQIYYIGTWTWRRGKGIGNDMRERKSRSNKMKSALRKLSKHISSRLVINTRYICTSSRFPPSTSQYTIVRSFSGPKMQLLLLLELMLVLQLVQLLLLLTSLLLLLRLQHNNVVVVGGVIMRQTYVVRDGSSIVFGISKIMCTIIIRFVCDVISLS